MHLAAQLVDGMAASMAVWMDEMKAEKTVALMVVMKAEPWVE